MRKQGRRTTPRGGTYVAVVLTAAACAIALVGVLVAALTGQWAGTPDIYPI